MRRRTAGLLVDAGRMPPTIEHASPISAAASAA
jgi:hypothetical protein